MSSKKYRRGKGVAQSATNRGARGRHPRMAFAAFLALAVGTAAYYHLRIPNIPDLDSFYHVTHAALYLEDGLFMTGFPWIPYSVIDRYAADIWYGFHLFLIPFTAIADPVLRIKLPGVVLTSGLLVAFWWSVARLHISKSYVWPFLLLFSGPAVMFHLIMTRPHVLSMALSALLFSFLIEGEWPAVLAASAGVTFFHLSFFWMIPVILLAVTLTRLATERAFEWRKPLAALAGLAGGWLARPNPIGAAKILWVQTVELVSLKSAGVPLAFARELAPITWNMLVQNFAVFLVFWTIAIVLAIAAIAGLLDRRRAPDPRMRVLLGSSLLLSLGFFAMMLLVARRSYDPWAVFAVILIAAAYECFLSERSDAAGGLMTRALPTLVTFAGGAGLVYLAVFSSAHNAEDTRKSTEATEYRDAAQWLESHSAARDIVYNVSWDSFPRLFFWDQKDRYVGGMDPIFQYAFDPALYWRSHWLVMGRTTQFMSSDAGCTPDTYEDTYAAIRRDFKASWLFLEKRRNPLLYAWLKRDPRFVPVFENAKQAVYDLRGSEAR